MLFFVVGPFLLPILFVLTLASDRAILFGIFAFSVFVLSTKKAHLKKIFVFQEISFKLKVLKLSKISSDCHIKTCRSLKRRAILKIASAVFQTNLCSFCWLKEKTSNKKRFHVLRQKPTQSLP